MPIYEYQCDACGHQLEKLQKMSDVPLIECPSCNEPELKKMMSASAFRLKGGGWYETDFKTGKKKNIEGDNSSSKSGSDSKSSDTKSASESKPSGKKAQ